VEKKSAVTLHKVSAVTRLVLEDGFEHFNLVINEVRNA